MAGNLRTQPRREGQVCQAAHGLDQNIGQHRARPRPHVPFRSIHRTKSAAVAGSNTAKWSSSSSKGAHLAIPAQHISTISVSGSYPTLLLQF